jgi:hypothetical protein
MPTQGETVTAYVVAQLPPAMSRELTTRSARTPEGRKLKRILEQHHAVVLPAHEPAVDEGGAIPYTTLELPDMASANRLATALRAIDGVESAYAKPGEELP